MNKFISHLLTGKTIRVRKENGELTSAGELQLYWCDKLLENMGADKSTTVSNEVIGNKVFSKSKVIKHKQSI